MRMETGTFELRDNDMMMRALTDAEINRVAGGIGTATVVVDSQSGPGSSQTATANFTLVTSNTTAAALSLQPLGDWEQRAISVVLCCGRLTRRKRRLAHLQALRARTPVLVR